MVLHSRQLCEVFMSVGGLVGSIGSFSRSSTVTIMVVVMVVAVMMIVVVVVVLL